MENVKLEDMVINGSGSVGGGTFNKVVINGSGTIVNDIECEVLKCNGTGKITGNVHAKSSIINGTSTITGNLFSESVEIHGHASVKGNMHFQQLEVKGASTVGKSVKGEQLTLEGSIDIAEDCECESFQAEGSFQIQGLLNADTITVTLHGKSYAKEIGGESITVKKRNSRSVIDKFIKTFSKTLKSDVIEGDLIHLEYTKAKVVRGNFVTLGPDCEIDLVEYKQELKADKDAFIKEKKKID
ncbi:polymer-forming cytoskeletal protein [Bacillus tianshenii]|uniref:polymer-forming cytoskeletal protein n=1 Tax=Sutcliffiella tianshenii TaxID=1463404 RepID=UPI001CD7164C|nr:polymer-forming cytoskeletal protein [Bacillus tianshenii]MCA1322389.1 polymer-forming cytoskeletal protein [Bacillus tianshenii]